MGGRDRCLERVYHRPVPSFDDPTLWIETCHWSRSLDQCLWHDSSEFCNISLAVVFDPGKNLSIQEIEAYACDILTIAISKQTTQHIQGFLFGLGAGMSIFTSIAIPAQWFEKKRGLATGVTVAGSGIGGASLAPLNRFMISRVGYPWALRIMGMFSVVVVMTILPCIRTRFPISRRRGPIFDLSMFKDRGFSAMYFMVKPFGQFNGVHLFLLFLVVESTPTTQHCLCASHASRAC